MITAKEIKELLSAFTRPADYEKVKDYVLDAFSTNISRWRSSYVADPMEQKWFFFKHVDDNGRETLAPLDVTKAEILRLGKTESLNVTTFICPECSHQVVYKITLSDLGQLIKSSEVQVHRRQV